MSMLAIFYFVTCVEYFSCWLSACLLDGVWCCSDEHCAMSVRNGTQIYFCPLNELSSLTIIRIEEPGDSAI